MKSWKHFILLVIIAAFFINGCGTDGPDGPPGQGAPDFDSEPPEVFIKWPPPNYIIYEDSLKVDFTATDNGYLDTLYLYVNGVLTGTLGRPDFEDLEQYSFTHYFNDSPEFEGLFMVNVEAIDSAKNSQTTPERPYFRAASGAGSQVLEYYYDYDLMCYPYPTAWEFNEDTTWTYERLAVRFTPESSGKLVALEAQFGEPLFWADSLKEIFDSVLVRNSDIELILWEGDGLNIPNVPIDSTEFFSASIKNTDFENERWTQLPLDGIIGDSADYFFEAGEDFFISLGSTENWTASLDGGFYIRISIDDSDNPVPEPGGFRSLETEEGLGGRGWGNKSQHDAYKYDYWIRAVVQYDDESTVSRIGSRINQSGSSSLESLEYLKRTKR